jgi:hypothetical protein
MEKWMKLSSSLLILVLCRYLPSATIAEGTKRDGETLAKPPAEKAPVEVKVESAVLQYFPREIPESKRTPRGEIEVIEGATATLKVEKAISFRRAKLPPGEYGLSVTADEGKSHAIVLEPKKKPAEGEEKAGNSSRAARRKTQDTSAVIEGARADGAGSAEKGEKKALGKEEEESSGSTRKKGESSPSEAGKPASSPQQKVMAPLKIIAPLRLSPAQTSSESLKFDLKVSGKGSRLRVILHAGSTEARTSQLRLDK